MDLNRTLKIVCVIILSHSLSLPSVAAIKPISPEQCEKMRSTDVITDKNPVSCERLRTVIFPIVTFSGVVSKGQCGIGCGCQTYRNHF